MFHLLRPNRLSRPYPSWETACKAGTYCDELVNRFRIARSTQKEAPEILLRVLQMVQAEHVVDFGGATGEIEQSVKTLCPRYTVVENPTLVRMMNRENFTDTIPKCDVFYSSGTLQYLPDPYGVLERAFQSAKKAVVLTRNSFSEIETFRVQHSPLFDNGSGNIPPGFKNRRIKYPHRTIQESRIKSPGFRLAIREELPPLAEGYNASLVFLKE